MKISCYANKNCLWIPKEDEIDNLQMTDKEKLREDFNNFKNILTNEIESMKFSFYKELNSFKNQLL